MDDSEAEAALLALGSQLHWEHNANNDGTVAMLSSDINSDSYSISKVGQGENLWPLGDMGSGNRLADLACLAILIVPAFFEPLFTLLRDTRCGFYRYRAFYYDGRDPQTRFYRTSRAAKAACERHHATGEWD